MPDVFVADQEEHNKKPLEKGKTEVIEKASAAMTTPVSRLKSLSAFLVSPAGVTFETQEEDETIVLLLRKHVVTNLLWILTSIIVFFLPFFFPIAAPILNLTAIPTRFQFIGLLLWYLLTLSFVFQNFLMWYYNVYIVTNHRVIDVDFFSLLYKRISDAPLSKIQDVTYSMGGVASALFNYGDVFIQTAAEVPNFEFLAVPSPEKVVKTITSLMGKAGGKS